MMNQYKTNKDSEFILLVIFGVILWLGYKFGLPVAVAVLQWLMGMVPG